MKKAFNFLSILFLYLATVPTNVMALGAFTEVWIKDFQISRQILTWLYLLSTGCVFVLLTAIKVRYSLKTTLFVLGLCCLITPLLSSAVTLFFMFVVLQWFGQGWMVEYCRALLLKTSSRTSYGIAVGVMEASGTLAVFICPFLFLFFIRTFSWQIIFTSLGIIYVLISIIISQYHQPAKALRFNHFRDGKFLLVNLIVYLPVLLASGFFFHLEACCEAFHLSLDLLETCSLQQGIGIVILQIVLGMFWKSETRTAYIFLFILVISQIVWLVNLFIFNKTLYLLTSILGWSLFGILVNTFWQFLYVKKPYLNEEKLKASVGFGFLANAVGPILIYALIKGTQCLHCFD